MKISIRQVPAETLLDISRSAGRPVSREWLERVLEGATVLVAEGPEPVGFAILSWFKYDRLGMELDVLSVRKEHQGRGVGSALLQKAEELAGREHAYLHLFASSDNRRALRFYTKRGYEPCGFLADRYGPGRHSTVLRKRLQSSRKS